MLDQHRHPIGVPRRGTRVQGDPPSRQEPAIFHLVFLLPGLVVAARTIWPLDLPVPLRCGLAVAALVASQQHLWSRLSSGSVFAPEFPRSLVILSNWALGTVLLLAPLQLAADVGLSAAWLVTGWHTGAPDELRYALFGSVAVLTAVGVGQAVRVPRVKDIEVGIHGLARPFDGYVLLQLTDLHISRLFPAAWVGAVVARSNRLGAEAILVTGDLIDGTLAMRGTDVEPLRALRAPDGVFAVPGNHEYFFDAEAWMRHFASMGMHVLANAHATLVRDGSALVLAGVTDASARRAGLPARDLAAALAGAPAGAPVVLLDHQPRDAGQAAASGVALQLSGHTHGGMIAGLDRLFARPNGGFVSGRYAVGPMVLYVSNGTGLWPGFALRLGRPAEITRITLRRAG